MKVFTIHPVVENSDGVWRANTRETVYKTRDRKEAFDKLDKLPNEFPKAYGMIETTFAKDGTIKKVKEF